MLRLDRVLSEHTMLSRSALKVLIRGGAASVNGRVENHPDVKIDPAADRVALNGVPLDCAPAYLMLNKPAGVICATEDPHRRTVLDLVPEALRRKGLFAAGRLDIDTLGFVLLTDDGAFAHRILSPKRHVEKAYIAEISGALAPDAVGRFAGGMALEDGTACRPARFELLRGEGPHFLARIVLCEGMFHQVKRMVACCGGEVVSLRRERIGGLALDEGLPPGGCRPLRPEEVRRVLD